MASQKEKFLNSAQKFIQKGQLDRAIRDYEQVVAADPKDVRQRQRLAELLARCNRNEDAIREYETIAKYYEEDGFYLKAIAVYKQIQKIDGKNIEISLTLAALNEKQGLIGNALSEYKNVFDYYEKTGLSKEACKVLEKMHAVDPENVDIRLKLAETLFSAGCHDDAYKGYTGAALMLKDRGNDVYFEKVCTRIQTLFPERKEFILDLLEEQIRNGTAADVVPTLKKMLEKDQTNRKLLSLLAQACKISGDLDGRKYAWSRMLHYFPSETDAKEGLLGCIVEEGNLEDSIKMLDLYAPDLVSAGLFEPLEKFYTTLQSQAPYDTRILEGLKALYEAGGEQAKLADIQVSLNILSSNVSEAQGGFSDYEEGVADADFAAEGLPGVTEIDFPWEEEIELTVPGDESDNDGGEQLFIAKSVEESRPEKHFPDSSPLDLEETLLEIEFDEESTDQKAEGESAPFELVLEVDNDTISDEGKYAMDGVFNEFEKVPDQQIEREDTETHFNLGIAYKEMGLYDIAIKEFIAAAVDPLRTADCLILQGICLREQGDLHRAEEVLLSGVERYDHEPGKSLNLRYELGLLYEASGRNDDALRAFRDVFGANPGFRDTVGKIARLHGIGDLLDLSDIDEVDIELEGIK